MQIGTELVVETGAKVVGNVLTIISGDRGPKPFLKQNDNGDPQGHGAGSDIDSVKGSTPATRPSRKRKAKGKRGPKGSKGLRWKEGVQEISSLDHLARSEGLVAVFTTIRAPKEMSLAQGKVFIGKRTAHLGQALQRPTRRRKGTPHIGLTVYEIEQDGGHLHAHHMVYVATRADMKIVARWADVFEAKPTGKRHNVTTHARPACETDIAYMTKQRLPLSPEVEANITHMRRPGGFIPGPRWTMTKHFRALRSQKPQDHGQKPVVRLVVSNPVEIATTTNIMQFGLPLDWKPSRPPTDAALMAQFCEVFGYTQEQAAKRLRYRDRSHVANILRGHDGMSPARRKLVQYYLETGLAA